MKKSEDKKCTGNGLLRTGHCLWWGLHCHLLIKQVVIKLMLKKW